MIETVNRVCCTPVHILDAPQRFAPQSHSGDQGDCQDQPTTTIMRLGWVYTIYTPKQKMK